MLNVLGVFTAFIIFYILFIVAGIGISRALFGTRAYLTSLLSPILGFSLFCLISTALMYYVPGVRAGQLGLILTLLLSMGLMWSSAKSAAPITLSLMLRCQSLGFLSGVCFLLPLFIAGEIGILALNGADFGSYAGWGEYFRDYTLRDATSHNEPINGTIMAFTNLQFELTRPNGHWRVGNVSLFTALNAFFPKYWPTIYTISMAFVIAQFTLGIQLFARKVLFQRLKNVHIIGLLSLLIATVYWLISSHYVPNVIGLAYTLFLLSLYPSINRLNPRLIVAVSILQGALLLLYPESFVFFLYLLAGQLLIREPNPFKSGTFNLKNSRILWAVIGFVLSVGLTYLWTLESFFRCVRHFLVITAYDRPGDFVGIDFMAYPSQGLGFADYNSVLRGSRGHWLRNLLVVNYVAAALVLVFGIRFRYKKNAQEVFRQRSYLMLAGSLAIFLIPIGNYIYQQQYLMGWRILLTISPYVWLLMVIAFLNAWAQIKVSQQTRSYAHVVVYSFCIVLASSLFFRGLMVKNIAFGATHAAIFGEEFAKSRDYLQANRKKFDIVFIDYEGTGTIQGGWEYYSQTLPYIFPEHGVGRNIYLTEPLNNKRIVIMSDKYQKVHKLKGFRQRTQQFNGLTVAFTDGNNWLQTYSSSWIYEKAREPRLHLPGMPGKLLLWLDEDSKACMSLKAHSERPKVYIRTVFDGNKSIKKSLEQLNDEKICHQFHKGLNSISLEPIFIDDETIKAQKEFAITLHERSMSKEKLSEEDRGLLLIYSQTFQAVNPLYSPTPQQWSTAWNLIIPPDRFPLNPHVIFTSIEIEKLDV